MFMSFNSYANGATSGERAAYPPPPGNTWVHAGFVFVRLVLFKL